MTLTDSVTGLEVSTVGSLERLANLSEEGHTIWRGRKGIILRAGGVVLNRPRPSTSGYHE